MSDYASMLHRYEWDRYRRQLRTWQVAYERWLADGALGPPPPQPERPTSPYPAR